MIAAFFYLFAMVCLLIGLSFGWTVQTRVAPSQSITSITLYLVIPNVLH